MGWSTLWCLDFFQNGGLCLPISSSISKSGGCYFSPDYVCKKITQSNSPVLTVIQVTMTPFPSFFTEENRTPSFLLWKLPSCSFNQRSNLLCAGTWLFFLDLFSFECFLPNKHPSCKFTLSRDPTAPAKNFFWILPHQHDKHAHKNRIMHALEASGFITPSPLFLCRASGGKKWREGGQAGLIGRWGLGYSDPPGEVIPPKCPKIAVKGPKMA